jgi:beta-glucanase (GH16 family)
MNAETIARIEEAGRDHGKSAASWYFDGNTADETYTRVLRGLEDGDPEILDTFPSSPLSGEWADGPTPQTLQHDFELNDDDVDEACDLYEAAFYQASQDEIERAAGAMV